MSESPEPTITDQYFICNKQWGVAICRQCEHGVKPNKIVRHLTSPKGKHRISKRVAEQVVDIIRHTDEWDSVEEETRSFPTTVSRPIPVLPVYQDRLQCQFCRQVYRSRDSLRVHWSKEHQFSAYGYGGKPRPSEVAAGKQNQEGRVKQVVCQRFFPRGWGSHYIYVGHPGAAYEPETPPP
ncbi:hypothetical protein N7476_004623 [Penicillium atrosanguineum]|uniref:C2H2-type domain-containing protein n=1 Tax=Penicillium atrosanguineum TaxID=1132637 RepID=A0A9W9PXS9_9EURO|nr:hypothetical protein N7476_004623 [Penicillium atrosanguineum]